MLTANVGSDADWFLGEDKALVFTIYQSGSTTVPQDLTGFALSYRVKRKLSDADVDAVVTKTTPAGIALTTPASGICTVTIADTDTDGLDEGLYQHELKRTDSGLEAVLAKGTVYLKRGVHRS